MTPSEPKLETPQWTKVIEPRRAIFDIPWREIWRYRELAWLMSKRDLSANYKQTLLGPLWFVIQPLFTTFVFAFIFGRLAGLGTDNLPHILFYFSGIALWTFFAECVNKTSIVFQKNASVFEKVYFPRLVVPVATAMTAMRGLLVQFACFIVFLLYHYYVKGSAVHPNWRMVLFPLFILQLAALGVGTGLLVAAVSVRFRDLTMGVAFAVQLWMYASTIVFPLSRIAPENRWMFYLNPVVPVIEAFRFAFLGFGKVEERHLIFSCAICMLVLGAGVLLFNKVEQTAPDSV